MLSRRVLTEFDFVLFGASVMLALIGVLGIYSATIQGGVEHLFLRQLGWVGLGVVVCLLVVSIDYHFLTDHAFFFYACGLLMLVWILFFGREVHGSKSWITLWEMRFQPSELVKLVVILTLARYLAEVNENYLKRLDFLILALITLVPAVLVILQGDLGTALMYLPILMGIMLVAGLRLRFLGAVLALTLCLAPAGWFSLEDYQKQRILVTFDPGIDPLGYGYQTRQSQIAVGSGGLFGKGLGHGSQGQLGFVPEVHTDFIVALLAEELGFVGISLILILYLLLIARLVRFAGTARDRAGILIVAGVASLFFCHVLVNVGMTLGILPTIGIPLPLLSYGGSSTMTAFAALGLALNVHYRRFVY